MKRFLMPVLLLGVLTFVGCNNSTLSTNVESTTASTQIVATNSSSQKTNVSPAMNSTPTPTKQTTTNAATSTKANLDTVLQDIQSELNSFNSSAQEVDKNDNLTDSDIVQFEKLN